MDLALLVLRLVVGLSMAAHGAQKLFGWFQGPGLSGAASFFENLGFRPGRLHARLMVLAELGGGLSIATGFLTPLGAAGIIGSMIAAIATFHWSKGFFNDRGGYEFNLFVAASALAIVLAGPGSASIDSALNWNFAGLGWALAAFALGAGTAAAVVVRRNRRATLQAAPASSSEESKAA